MDQRHLTLFNQLNINNHRASSGALFLYYPTKHYLPALYLSVSTALKIDSNTHPIPQFLYPQTHTIIPLSSLHFPPFLPTFTHPPLPLWKMWENLWKTYLKYSIIFKYCLIITQISKKYPENPPLDILSLQIIIRLGDLTHIFSLNYVIRLEGHQGSYIFGEPSFPTPPPLPEKTFSLFSSSPHFVRVAVVLFFIYRT